MGKFIAGEIVVLPFPFSDLSASKRRPALVLVGSDGSDIILCQITSQNVRDSKAILISTHDIEKGALNQSSNVRPNKLFTADEKIVLYKVGNLSHDKYRVVVNEIIRMFVEGK